MLGSIGASSIVVASNPIAVVATSNYTIVALNVVVVVAMSNFTIVASDSIEVQINSWQLYKHKL
jgi:hypothetical protein